MVSLAEIGKIKGVKVYAHWSVFAISVLILLNAIKAPMISLIGLLCYWGGAVSGLDEVAWGL